MPNRILRDWTDSEKVNALSANSERFFVRLIMKADDYGRFDGRASILRAGLFPTVLDKVTERDLEKWLQETEKAALVTVYCIEGRRYIQINNFGQRMRDGAKAKYPAPPDDAAGRGGSPELAAGRGGSPPYSETETNTETEAGASAAAPPPSRDAESVPEAALKATKAPPFEACFAQLRSCAPEIPEGFARVVYAGWLKNGCRPRYPDYVRGRWALTEGEEWKAGVHSEQKRAAELRKGGGHERKKSFTELAGAD